MSCKIQTGEKESHINSISNILTYDSLFLRNIFSKIFTKKEACKSATLTCPTVCSFWGLST